MRASLVVSVAVASAVLAAAAPAAAARTFAADGPHALEVKSLSSSVRVVTTTDGADHPLLIASHGWSASGDNQLGWAKHFASWGFVVAVPSFPNAFTPDAKTDAGIIADLVTRLEGADAATYHVAHGPYGLEGHSAGGLATAVAAAALAPAAVVLFDPVDKDGEGKKAYAALCAPLLDVFAGPSSCNNDAEWRAFAPSTTGDVVAFGVKNSTHCDGENAARPLCGVACGGAASADRQAVMAHYATAFFLARLTNDAAAAAELQPAALSADGDLDGVVHVASTCSAPGGDAAPTAPPDAGGPSGGDAGRSGAGGAAGESGAPEGDGSSPAAADSGCGCRAAPSRSVGPWVLAAALGLAALRRRRR